MSLTFKSIWTIDKTFDDEMNYAYNGDGKKYMCETLPSYYDSRPDAFDAFKNEFNIPLLPIVYKEYYKDNTMRVFFKRAYLLNKIGNFNTKKIVDFIIEMAKFNYKTGFRIIFSFGYELYVKDEKIYIDPFNDIIPMEFNEREYLEQIEILFETFGEYEICEKIKYFRKNASRNDKSFDNFKKNILSCLENLI